MDRYQRKSRPLLIVAHTGSPATSSTSAVSCHGAGAGRRRGSRRRGGPASGLAVRRMSGLLVPPGPVRVLVVPGGPRKCTTSLRSMNSSSASAMMRFSSEGWKEKSKPASVLIA
jgi:hypothetical protein